MFYIAYELINLLYCYENEYDLTSNYDLLNLVSAICTSGHLELFLEMVVSKLFQKVPRKLRRKEIIVFKKIRVCAILFSFKLTALNSYTNAFQTFIQL